MHTHTDKSDHRPPILYFGNNWDAENRTSSHHIARCLAKQHDVYYIECPGMRAPGGSGRDLAKIAKKVRRALRGTREVAPRLKVQTLLQVPFHRFGLVRRFNEKWTLLSVRRLMRRHGVRQPIAWFVAPHVASLVGRLGEAASVYYVTDDHASMPGMDRISMRAMDERLTREASVVFVASDTLLAAKSKLNPNTHYSPHGVDVEHFGLAAQPDGPVPEDIKDLKAPIIGFFGLIERWIDLEMVGYLARQRPDWTFLMIGRVAVLQDHVPAPANVHFIGPRPYEQLPDYGRRFAASIIPYKLTQSVFHSNSLKSREYLAMGKPVVSVRTPQIEKLAEVIDIADNREQFLACLDRAVARPNTPEAIQRRMAYVASSSWEARVAEVLRTIQATIDKRPCHAGSPCCAGTPT